MPQLYLSYLAIEQIEFAIFQKRCCFLNQKKLSGWMNWKHFFSSKGCNILHRKTGLTRFITIFILEWFSVMNTSDKSSRPEVGVPRKRYSENIQQIYRRTPMPRCDFNKVASQLYEMALRHGWFPVHLLHIFRTPFPRNTSEWLHLNIVKLKHQISAVFHFVYICTAETDFVYICTTETDFSQLYDKSAK